MEARCRKTFIYLPVHFKQSGTILYSRMISAPCFHDDRVPLYLTNDAILERFVEIIDKRKNFVPVSCTWRYYPQYVVAKLKDACVILLHPSKFVD